MEFKELNPSQVITTRDFPVHSAKFLEKYFEIFQSGNGFDLPPVPLVHTDLVTLHFEEPISSILQEFLRQNPQAEYFLLNGSHRTTSANLTRHLIKGMLLATEQDIEQANQIKFRGEMYQHGLHSSIIGNIRDLVDHFSGAEKFQTVQQKTDRMADEKVISQHMIEYYRNSLK